MLKTMTPATKGPGVTNNAPVGPRENLPLSKAPRLRWVPVGNCRTGPIPQWTTRLALALTNRFVVMSPMPKVVPVGIAPLGFHTSGILLSATSVSFLPRASGMMGCRFSTFSVRSFGPIR